MTERVREATLAVRPPGHTMILDSRSGDCAASNGALDEVVGVIGKHFDTGAGDASLVGTGFCGVLGIDLVEEERGATDLKAGYATKVPQLRRAQRSLVPGNRSLCIWNNEIVSS